MAPSWGKSSSYGIDVDYEQRSGQGFWVLSIEDPKEREMVSNMDYEETSHWFADRIRKASQEFRSSGDLLALRRYMDRGVIPEDPDLYKRLAELRLNWERIRDLVAFGPLEAKVLKEDLLKEIESYPRNSEAMLGAFGEDLGRLPVERVPAWRWTQHFLLTREIVQQGVKRLDFKPRIPEVKVQGEETVEPEPEPEQPKYDFYVVATFEPKEPSTGEERSPPELDEREVVSADLETLFALERFDLAQVTWDEAVFRYVESTIGTPGDLTRSTWGLTFKGLDTFYAEDLASQNANLGPLPGRLAHAVSMRDPTRTWSRRCISHDPEVSARLFQQGCKHEPVTLSELLE